jgi:hypothetical protein
MIVSASRRCDIPAFAGDWFMERLRAGEVDVANPFRPGPGRRISLRREDVDAIVFWSRDPRPFLAHLPEIDRRGTPYYFLLTLTGYPRLLEPAVPRVEEAVAYFGELAARIGRRRVIWRYDPVIFFETAAFDFHVGNFADLASLLSPFSSRVIVSFFDPYARALRRLRKAGIAAEAAVGTPDQQALLLECFAAIAAGLGLEIQSCAEAALPGRVKPGKCIDEGLLNELFGLNLSYRKDPAQRKLCLCQQSVDIGSYGACRHGCLYCYAR